MIQDLLQKFSHWFQDFFLEKGMSQEVAMVSNIIINIIIISLVIFLIDYFLKKVIITSFKFFSNKTKTTFDDFLVVSNFPRFIAHSFPILIARYSIPIIFKDFPKSNYVLTMIINIVIIILCVYIFRSVLRTTRNFLKRKNRYKDKPLESYVQVLMIFAWGAGIFLTISMLTGYSTISMASLGTVSAVILLIFKDTILGFVASIQISVNDIVRIGDWITFNKYGADGYVTEINLATVKVQNFDYTYTTIPTYSLIADSFQNWRGMQESDGRRIKKSIYIKQNSIHFLSEKEATVLKKLDLIKEYISELDFSETKDSLDKNINLNKPTNLTALRNYIDSYIQTNKSLNKEMYYMVRYLDPTPQGLPLEFICFSYEKKWELYEDIQSTVLDHILGVLPYFGLEIFESPTGIDFKTALLKN